MKHLFVPYKIAELAKKNGFNENCLACYDGDNNDLLKPIDTDFNFFRQIRGDKLKAPLYQQLIDWFRVEHNMLIWVETATYLREFNYRYYIETYDNKAEGMKTNDYYKALNEAIKKAFKMIPQISK